jgi:hypothetical protein
MDLEHLERYPGFVCIYYERHMIRQRYGHNIKYDGFRKQ